jgi:hypothetical protein
MSTTPVPVMFSTDDLSDRRVQFRTRVRRAPSRALDLGNGGTHRVEERHVVTDGGGCV